MRRAPVRCIVTVSRHPTPGHRPARRPGAAPWSSPSPS